MGLGFGESGDRDRLREATRTAGPFGAPDLRQNWRLGWGGTWRQRSEEGRGRRTQKLRVQAGHRPALQPQDREEDI